MNLNDKRVIQTRNKIRQALLNLMKTKPVSQITVKEICDLAVINRNTFYSHYGTPMDILLEIEQEYYKKMQLIQETAISNGDIEALVLAILEALLENRDFGMVLYGNNNNVPVSDPHQKNTYSRVMLSWIESGTSVPAEHLRWLLTYLSGGIDLIIRTWVQTGMKEDPHVIAALAAKMSNACCASIFE